MGGNISSKFPPLTEEQLQRLTPQVKAACLKSSNFKDNIARLLSRGISYEQINEYFNGTDISGLLVDRDPETNKITPPPENSAVLARENKDNREVITAQWEAFYRERYTENKGEAKHDIIRLLCHKEVKQVQGSYRDLWNYTDNSDPDKRDSSLRLRMKYVNSNPKKAQELEAEAKAFIEQYKDKLDDKNLIDQFEAAFAPKSQTKRGKTNTHNVVIEKLTMDDLKALAQFHALNKVTSINGGMTTEEIDEACEELAIETISDKELNTALVKEHECNYKIKQIINKNRNLPEIKTLTDKYVSDRLALEGQKKGADAAKVKELDDQIAALEAKYEQDCENALPEKDRKEISKLRKDIIKARKKSVENERDFVEKNMDKLVKLAAATQVQIDIQKYNYDNAPKPAYSELDKDVQKLIQANPQLFCDEITDPKDDRTPSFEVNGKKYAFNIEKYRTQMLAFASAGKTSGEFQDNKQDGKDYFCDLPELDTAYRTIISGGLGDNLVDEEKRKVMKKAMKAAGIATEADHTTQKIIGEILKAGAIGFGTGVGGLLLADTLATLRTCEFTEKIYELATLTRMIPYSGTKDYSGSKDYSGTEDWHFNKDYTVEGDVDWHFSKDYQLNGETDWHFSKDFDLEGNDATWSGEYSWVFDDNVIVNHEHNGIILDTRDIPVHGEGTGVLSGNDGHWQYRHHVDESGTTTWEYLHHVDESGTEHWEKTFTVDESGTVTYHGTVDYSGTVEYSGEVENPDADRTLYEQKDSKTRKLRPQFHKIGDYAKAGAITAGLAMVGKTLDIFVNGNKPRDEGLRKAAEANRVISQKDVRQTQRAEEEDPPVPEEFEYIQEEYDVIGEKGEEGTPDEDVVNIKMNQKGNVIFWYQTAEAYDIPQGLTAKDIYNRIRELNGDPDHNKYAPDEVGLPLEIEVKGIKVRRKDSFTIKGINYKPTGKGPKRGKGTTYQGYKGTPGKAGSFQVVKKGDHSAVVKDGFTEEDPAKQWADAHKPAPQRVKKNK